MEQTCREWADAIQHEPSRAALLELADNYSKSRAHDEWHR
jgi:hypothetical protein